MIETVSAFDADPGLVAGRAVRILDLLVEADLLRFHQRVEAAAAALALGVVLVAVHAEMGIDLQAILAHLVGALAAPSAVIIVLTVPALVAVVAERFALLYGRQALHTDVVHKTHLAIVGIQLDVGAVRFDDRQPAVIDIILATRIDLIIGAAGVAGIVQSHAVAVELRAVIVHSGKDRRRDNRDQRKHEDQTQHHAEGTPDGVIFHMRTSVLIIDDLSFVVYLIYTTEIVKIQFILTVI